MSIELPDRPFFSVAFEVHACRFAIRFNDIPLFTGDVSGRQIDAEIPVNLHLVDGPNTLSVDLRPGSVALADRAVLAQVELCVRSAGTPASQGIRLAGVTYEHGALTALDGAVDAPVVAPPDAPVLLVDTNDRVHALRSVAVRSPFAPWLWTRATPLGIDDVTTSEVLGEYRKFWSILQRKDISALRAATADNARDVQVGFHLPDIDTAYAVLTLEELIGKSSVTLSPMASDLRMELVADGRMARLVGPDGRSAIRVIDTDFGGEGAISVMFSRVPSRGWVQIR